MADKEEFLFSTAENAQALKRQKQSGKLRRVARGIFTSNLTDDLGMVVRRNAEDILDRLFLGAVVSHRSAFEFADRANRPEHLFLTLQGAPRIVRLPGLIIHLLRGKVPTRYDAAYRGFFIASRERALLENLIPSRKRGGIGKSVARADLEKRIVEGRGLETLEAHLNRLRDGAREQAELLGLEREFKELDDIIGAILGSRAAELTIAPERVERARAMPYDTGRLRLFERLALALRDVDTPSWMRPPQTGALQPVLTNLAFYEAYFSNYIEGTKFVIEEAEAMVFDGVQPAGRPEDERDVRHTYALLSDLSDIRRVPGSPEELIELLKSRHNRIMAHRPENLPGDFKTRPNQAGETRFVEPELVEGTIRQAFRIYADRVATPFARAIFMGVAISEIHTFTDGNGRVARAMMNAELVSADQCRILIPTGACEDYLLALRAFSRQERCDAIIKMLSRCQALTSMVVWAPRPVARELLRALGAFDEPPDARLYVPESALSPALQEAASRAEKAGADLQMRAWDPATRSRATAEFPSAIADYARLMPDFPKAREAIARAAHELAATGLTELEPLIESVTRTQLLTR
ncbi:MAG: Fic family protein [Candidatus Binataceae bacterium]